MLPNFVLYRFVMFPTSSCFRLEASVPGLAKNMSLGNKTYCCAHLLAQLVPEHFSSYSGLRWKAELRC